MDLKKSDMYAVASSSPLPPGARPSISSDASLSMCVFMAAPSTETDEEDEAAFSVAEGRLQEMTNHTRKSRLILIRRGMAQISVRRKSKSIWLADF